MENLSALRFAARLLKFGATSLASSPLDAPLSQAPQTPESSNAAPLSIPAARWFVVLAAVLWSSAGFFAKSPLTESLQGGPIALWRAVFAGLVLLPFVRRPYFTIRLLPMLLCYAAMTYTYLQAFYLGSAANAIWLQSTAPAWVILAERLIFKSDISRRDYLMTGLCLTGIGIILFFELRQSLGDPRAIYLGVTSGVFYACVVLSLKRLSHQDPFWLASLNNLFSAGVLFVFLPLVNDYKTPQGMQWLLVIAFGGLQMGLPYALFSRSLRVLPSHECSAIVLIEPILVPVWAFLTAREATPPWTIAGAIFIFCGLILRYAIPQAGPAVKAKEEALSPPPSSES